MTFRKLLLPFLVLGCPADGDSSEGADTGGTGGTSGTAGTGGSSSSAGENCMPGLVEACLCPDGGASTQVCLADGSGFSACDCVGVTTMDDDSVGSMTSPESTDSTPDTATESTDEGPAESGSDGSSTGPAPECDGSSHPLVEGDLRYCEAGNCYCGDFSVKPPFDLCYPEAIAAPCCPVEVVCY